MISQNIKKQILEAMKAKDSVRLSTLKLLSAELHNEWIAKQHDLSGEEELAVVRREVKKRKDAIEAYQIAGRVAQADTEKEELAILEEFLPSQMGDEELDQLVNDSIKELNVSSLGDMGKVIGVVKAKAGATADGARIAVLVKQKLAQ